MNGINWGMIEVIVGVITLGLMLLLDWDKIVDRVHGFPALAWLARRIGLIAKGFKRHWKKFLSILVLVLLGFFCWHLVFGDWLEVVLAGLGVISLLIVGFLVSSLFEITPAITSPILVYDFIDEFGEATLRNEGGEKIRPVERALSKRPGGTEMRAIYAHPRYPHENTVVTYQLPVEFAVARHLFLAFAVAILGEHPLEKRGCGFRDAPDNRARFEVCVNGKTVFTRVFDVKDPHLFEWEHHAIPITETKGPPLKVDLITNAMGDLFYNWTAWGEPKLIAIFGA